MMIDYKITVKVKQPHSGWETLPAFIIQVEGESMEEMFDDMYSKVETIISARLPSTIVGRKWKADVEIDWKRND